MSLSEAFFTPTRPASPQPQAARRAEEPVSPGKEEMSFSEMLDREDPAEMTERPSATGSSAQGRAAVSGETTLILADPAPDEPVAGDDMGSAISQEIGAIPTPLVTISTPTGSPLTGQNLVTTPTLSAAMSDAAIDAAAGPGAMRAAEAASLDPSSPSDAATSSGQKSATPGTGPSKDMTGAAGSPGSGGATPLPQATSQTPAPAPDLSGLSSASLDGPVGSSSTGAALSGQGSGTGGATPSNPAHPALAQAPSAAVQVYVRFVERFDGRAQQFNIRLDPAELGRVDVRLEIGADQKGHAVLAAHDSAALSDLIRGSKALEQALASSGVDLAEGGLRFELSEDRQERSGSGGAQTGSSNERGNRPALERPLAATSLSDPLRGPQPEAPGLIYSWRPARLNLLA